MDHAFPCGNLALDFIGTLRARRSPAPTEMLTTPARLDSWFEESRLVDGDARSTTVNVDDAITLREAIYSLVAARMAKKPYDRSSLAIVNDFARTPSVIPQLASSGHLTEASASQALSSVARDAVDILGGSRASLLKECSRPECTQTYLDQSRGGRREWCAMETCGNKMKARAYRARQRERSPQTT